MHDWDIWLIYGLPILLWAILWMYLMRQRRRYARMSRLFLIMAALLFVVAEFLALSALVSRQTLHIEQNLVFVLPLIVPIPLLAGLSAWRDVGVEFARCTDPEAPARVRKSVMVIVLGAYMAIEIVMILLLTTLLLHSG